MGKPWLVEWKAKKKNSTIFTNDNIKVFAQFSNARERITLSAKRHFLFGTWLYGCSPVSYERPAMPTHPTWSQDSKLTPDLWAETEADQLKTLARLIKFSAPSSHFSLQSPASVCCRLFRKHFRRFDVFALYFFVTVMTKLSEGAIEVSYFQKNRYLLPQFQYLFGRRSWMCVCVMPWYKTKTSSSRSYLKALSIYIQFLWRFVVEKWVAILFSPELYIQVDNKRRYSAATYIYRLYQTAMGRTMWCFSWQWVL